VFHLAKAGLYKQRKELRKMQEEINNRTKLSMLRSLA
jgi:hypothetical protein